MRSPGIFISYSREDEKQAMHLLAFLRREGYSVWIDQEAIAGASIWSDEIVQNIKSSEIFIALLSSSSVASANVAKEIALAAEHGKIILPVEIGTVELPGRLEYALAGIQKTNFHDEESILRAVRNQVARLERVDGNTIAPEAVSLRSSRRRRMALGVPALVLVVSVGLLVFFHHAPEAAKANNSIVVIPFATLNLDRDSTHNLDVFSEGLLTQLASVNTVTTVGADVAASYRNTQLNALAIARELNARFIVEGVVRKAHDLNFISARVIDAKRGGEVWEQSYTGNNRELFPIREKLAYELTGFLRAITGDELDIQTAEARLAAHPNDAAAYADLARRLLGNDKKRSLDLFEHAIKLDSTNISYYLNAGIVADRAGDMGRMKEFGRVAATLCKARMREHPDSANLVTTYVIALDMAGESARAEHLFDSLLRLHPTDERLTYNAACCLAKEGKADPAVDMLARLFAFAPGKKVEVQSDPDFDNIRSSPRYQTLVYGPAH